MTTNIPSLGWRGEAIRLVKCSDDLTSAEQTYLENAAVRRNEGLFGFPDVKASWIVEEWGGGQRDPSLVDGSSGFFFANGALCARGSFISQGAGLARIKLAVNVDTTVASQLRSTLLGINQRSTLLSHQFLAGWMTLNDPSLTELPLGGDGPNDPGNPLGSGALNSFWAGNQPGNEGVLRTTVTGTLPVAGDFTGAFNLGNLTMPNDWPKLAARFASDANVENENPQYRWDVHDDSALESSAVEGHPLDTSAPPTCKALTRPANLPAPRLDAVDNCAGGQAFSSAWDADGPTFGIPAQFLGVSRAPTVGPFDPQRGDETFLPDGNLTADDAPMPAARIDFTIGANKGGQDTDGVGSFGKTDKHDVFSADRSANANAGTGNGNPHNLYAPFYQAYVPATGSPNAAASGTDGGPGNDFSGFLVGDGQGGEGDPADRDQRYDYWDIAHEFAGRNLPSYATQCLQRNDTQGERYRLTPEGPQKVSVYTDEHGQAMVNFRPGTGFWYDALLAKFPQLGGNLNGGCDLKYLPDNVLGRADITAGAFYPYQPVSDQPAQTAAITKTVRSLFAKYLAVYPKGQTSDLANARVVVVHAQDVDGTPLGSEVVCFSNTSANGIVRAYVPNGSNASKVGPYDLTGSDRAEDPINSQSDKRVCMRTNEYGNAAIEVLESQRQQINIMADFTAEGLLRSVEIPFGETTPSVIDPGIPPRSTSTGTSTPTPGQAQAPVAGPPAQTANGNTTPTKAVIAAALKGTDLKVSASRPNRRARASVRFARVVNSARGKRYLSLRLRGRAGRVRVRIQMIGYNRKVLRTVTRTVRVGRTVRLRSVRISRSVRTVRVRVLR